MGSGCVIACFAYVKLFVHGKPWLVFKAYTEIILEEIGCCHTLIWNADDKTFNSPRDENSRSETAKVIACYLLCAMPLCK